MSKTYNLQGPILLEGLSNTDALTFVATIVDAIPSYSMGSANLNIKAQGPAGTSTCVAGDSADELQTSLNEAQAAPKSPEDIVYDVRGRVNLVGLSFEDGMQLIDAVMAAIPTDSLIMTGMLVQEVPQNA
jgi:hypothetical protein